ncbi:MAG: citrate lyase subunit alpha, partial [Candidatus Bipolaricaulota bacterium]|nr:citrate lyase subunit alpha [Candidatus Bipolaricaulota bacterium]
MKNVLGREVPEQIDGRALHPFQGAFSTTPTGCKAVRPQKMVKPGEKKVLHSIEEAIEATGLKSGMTISFHHSFREGDRLVNMVVDACARMGLKDLRLFPTALFPVHAPVIEHIKKGVVTRIEGSMNGPIGAFVSQGGKLKAP